MAADTAPCSIYELSLAQQKIKNLSATSWGFKSNPLIENDLDPSCMVNINKRLVRVEYPGEVRHIDKCINSLGGIEKVEFSVADHNTKLGLSFHPTSVFNKPCYADRDYKPGVLIKIKKKFKKGHEKEFEVVGVAVMSFTFNRLCDFQYLPLICKYPEAKSSKADYVYESILPLHLPTSNWLQNEVSKDMEPFMLPTQFSNYDRAQNKINVDTCEKTEQTSKPKESSSISLKTQPNQKSVCRIFGKSKQQTSVFCNFSDDTIPLKPLDTALKLLKGRNLDMQLTKVKKLFEERPIWTKAAIRYITGLTDEHSKIVLPLVAYHVTNGPWRITWIKFGYDPRKDPKARIYQTLDYRIRAADSTKLKVSAKRSYARKATQFLNAEQTKTVTLKHDMFGKPKMELDERHFTLRPLTIPPARQMFYQFCDLLIPEIQDMISRLPRICGNICHPKNGFLPENFIERSRQVVNEYVLEAVQKEVLEEKKILEEKFSQQSTKKEVSSQLDYYNQMLSNIKKGIYKNTVEIGTRQSLNQNINLQSSQDQLESISLSSDEENEYTVGEIIQSSIPERLEIPEEADDSDVTDLSEDAEIDLDVVEEINAMLAQLKSEEGSQQ